MSFSHLNFFCWELSVYIWSQFWSGLFDILMSGFLSSLYILEISPLSDVRWWRYFPIEYVGCLFVLLQKLLCFRRCHLSIVALSIYSTDAIFRTWSSVPMHSRILFTFSSIKFSVTGFIVRSLIYLDLIFVHGDRYGSTGIFLHVDIYLCHHHLLYKFSLCYFKVLASVSKTACSLVCELLVLFCLSPKRNGSLILFLILLLSL